MKRVILISILTLLSINYLRAQTYGLDNADPAVFTKFKVPDTDLRTLWLNTGLNLSTSKRTQNYYYDISNYNSDFRFNLSPNYFLLNETDDRYLALTAYLNTTYDKSYSENKSNYDQFTNINKSNSYNGNLNVQFTLNNYFNHEDVFYSFGSNIIVQMNDNKSEQDQASISSTYEGNKLQNYIFSFGIGKGKLRNVTPVVSALRFQERMKQLNLINNDLSENTIEGLAQQFYKQTYYSQIHDRPDKYFWQDIEKTLSKGGVSLSGLNMYADNYLRETTNEIRFMRNEGLIAQMDIQLNYNNIYSSFTTSKIAEQFFTLVNLYLEYSHQLNLNSQLRFNLSLSGGPNILTRPAIRQEYSLNGDIGYDYELTDRLVISLEDTFYILFQNTNEEYRNVGNTLGLTANYFVEDNLSLYATYNWDYNDSKYFSTTIYNSQNHNSLSIGFTYYFERGFLYQ